MIRSLSRWFSTLGVVAAMTLPAVAATQLTGAGSTFDYPFFSKAFYIYSQQEPRRHRQLSVDRQRRRHPAVHRQERRLRRHRRADERVGAGPGWAAGPPDTGHAGRRGDRLQPAGRDEAASAHAPGRGGHLSRQNHQVERSADRQEQPRRQPSRHADRGGPPFRRLGHELHLHGFLEPRFARVEEQGWNRQERVVAGAQRRRGKRQRRRRGSGAEHAGCDRLRRTRVRYREPHAAATLQNRAGTLGAGLARDRGGGCGRQPDVSATNFSIVDAPGANAWPISGYSWVVVYKKPSDANRAKLLYTVLSWLVGPQGQSNAKSVDYVPLPGNVQATALCDAQADAALIVRCRETVDRS